MNKIWTCGIQVWFSTTCQGSGCVFGSGAAPGDAGRRSCSSVSDLQVLQGLQAVIFLLRGAAEGAAVLQQPTPLKHLRVRGTMSARDDGRNQNLSGLLEGAAALVPTFLYTVPSLFIHYYCVTAAPGGEVSGFFYRFLNASAGSVWPGSWVEEKTLPGWKWAAGDSVSAR